MKYRLSGRAKSDIAALHANGVVDFGEFHADKYLDSLFETFELLAKWPKSGRDMSEFVPGLKQYLHISHHILYVVDESGLHVVRVRHVRMNPNTKFDDLEPLS